MKRVLVRYRVKADKAEENQNFIESVFEELHGTKPEGLRYASFKLDDGVSFVHIASIESDAKAAIASLLVLVAGCKPSTAKVEYETLEPGVQVLRLWEVAEPELPRIAILRLSQGAHEEYHRDPAAFMNARNIFPQPLRISGECLQATDGFGPQVIGLQAIEGEGFVLAGSSAGQDGYFPFWIGKVVRDPDGFFI